MGCGASTNTPPVQPVPADTTQQNIDTKKDNNVVNRKQSNPQATNLQQKNSMDAKNNLQSSSTSKITASKSPDKK